jgi:tetratricopeptide (TPR) repeat protein
MIICKQFIIIALSFTIFTCTDKKEDYYSRGLVKYKNGDYTGAVLDFDNALKRDPNYSLAFKARGDAKSELGNEYESAMSDYDKAIEINPNYEEAFIGRALLNHNTGLSQSDSKERLTEALKDLNKVLDINPNSAIAYSYKAMTKRALDDYLGSLQELNKAIELFNDLEWCVYNDRGYIFLLLGAMKEALDDFNRAEAIAKNTPIEKDLCLPRTMIYEHRATVKQHLKDYNGAIDDYSRAIEIFPGSQFYMNRGYLYLRQGKKYEACLDFSSAGERGLESAYEEIKKHCGVNFEQRIRNLNPNRFEK